MTIPLVANAPITKTSSSRSVTLQRQPLIGATATHSGGPKLEEPINEVCGDFDRHRYVKTKHCGIIDWGHANPKNARQLIDTVRRASDLLKVENELQQFPASAATAVHEQKSSKWGIAVNAFQTEFTINRPLTDKQILSVALGIFQHISIGFEEQQGLLDKIKAPIGFGRSSFSIEDLPSNIVSFYRAAKKLSPKDVLNICGCRSNVDDSPEGTNTSFIPQSGSWPSKLNDILPEKPGVLWHVTADRQTLFGVPAATSKSSASKQNDNKSGVSQRRYPTLLRLQPKLTVNTPGDGYEQEADRVAQQVMRMPEPKVQRQCSCGKSSTEGECSECKKKKQESIGTLQRVASSPAGGIAAPPIVDRVLSSPGSPLPESTRIFMESRIGHDFSQVRVHTDAQAQDSAHAVSARAYTVGQHIIFGQGEHPTADRRLLAHELTHVVQQGVSSGNTIRRQLTPSNPPSKTSRNLSTLSHTELQTEYSTVKSRLDRPMSYTDRWVDELYSQQLRDELAKRGTYDVCEGEGCALGYTQQGRRVNAYYFAGQTPERALVIGGVHGSELSGVEVAETLVANLKTATTKPHYTVIVVPVLFPDNRDVAEANAASIGTTANTGRKTKGRVVDPNRQMPALGTAFNPKNPVRATPTDPKDKGVKDLRIEPVNIMLLNLVDRFQPSRIASIHAFRPPTVEELKKNPKLTDSSGIYADPKTDASGTALGFAADEALAIKMARRSETGGANVPGNTLASSPNALYPKDPKIAPAGQKQPRMTDTGISHGGYFSTAVTGGRPAMTVITVEVQTAHPSKTPRDPKATPNIGRLKELQAHAISLQEVFLGPP